MTEKNTFFQLQCNYKKSSMYCGWFPVVNPLTICSVIIHSIQHQCFQGKKKKGRMPHQKQHNNLQQEWFFLAALLSWQKYSNIRCIKVLFVFVEDSNLHKQLKTKLNLLFFFCLIISTALKDCFSITQQKQLLHISKCLVVIQDLMLNRLDICLYHFITSYRRVMILLLFLIKWPPVLYFCCCCCIFDFFQFEIISSGSHDK